MDSSRVFVKGLPPTIDEATFRKHFAYAGNITDVKLMPQRRIGYVGYTTPAEAAKSVKRLNRSFIRMSRVSVEPAKPVADPSLNKAKKPLTKPREPTDASTHPLGKPSAPDSTSPDNAKKRKREEPADEADPKLQEFLGVMQSAKSTANAVHETDVASTREPPAKMAAVPVQENESDDEYESIPARKKVPRPAPAPIPQAQTQAQAQIQSSTNGNANDASSQAPSAAMSGAEADADTAASAADAAPPAPATDDDWLRSRTNRLLDLVDDDDPIPLAAPSRSPPQPAADVDATQDHDMEEPITTAQEEEDVPAASAPAKVERSSKDSVVDSIRSTSRLFVRNLPYSATEDDVRAHFGSYGDIQEVHVPITSSGNNKGFAFVLFDDADAAVGAFQEADGHTFQGRILHVLPGTAKRDAELDEYALSKLPLKQQNLIKKKAKAATSKFNWNSLYMNQDAVVASASARLGISKAELLDPTSSDAAVKQAMAETATIQDTKSYFAANGVDLNAFKSSERGDTGILVKNFEYGTSPDEIRTMFEEHGQVLRVLMPPTGTIAVVQFAQAPQAKAAFAKLAYRRFKNSILFLEKAPKNLFVDAEQQAPAEIATPGASQQKLSVSELLERDADQGHGETSSLHVKNLSFNTTTADLTSAFRHLEGFRIARVKTKTDPKKPGQILSMGFGFVEFSSKESAAAAQQVMDGHALQGHKLQVRSSHRGRDAAEERKREDDARKAVGHRTKLIVKNLPFEATKKDLRTLFGAQGQVRAVRVPKKFNHSARGYAFVDFTTPREAENAMKALQDTHLLGRKLVVQFAEAETVDPEEEIRKMQEKVGRQANKVALQQLTGGGRKKVTLGDNEDEGDMM